jgi:polyisoprenoid-binding protein YceI
MNAWQDTVRFPEITFELKAIAPTPDGGYSARGTLRLHGRAREETLALRIGADAGGLAIDGTAVLDTRNYGLPIFRKFWVLTVNPVVRVRFHLRGSWAPVDRSGRGGT